MSAFFRIFQTPLSLKSPLWMALKRFLETLFQLFDLRLLALRLPACSSILRYIPGWILKRGRRVFHNNTFSPYDPGGLGISYHNGKIDCDFFSGFLEAIFIAAGHFRFWMEFHVKYNGKMLKNQKSRFSPAETIFIPLFDIGSRFRR